MNIASAHIFLQGQIERADISAAFYPISLPLRRLIRICRLRDLDQIGEVLLIGFTVGNFGAVAPENFILAIAVVVADSSGTPVAAEIIKVADLLCIDVCSNARPGEEIMDGIFIPEGKIKCSLQHLREKEKTPLKGQRC